MKWLNRESTSRSLLVLQELRRVLPEVGLGRLEVRQSVWKPDEQFPNSEVRIVKVKIVTAPQHLDGVSAEVAIMVFVVERPGSDLGPRRLPPHVLKVFFTDRAIDGAKGNALMFAHQCSSLVSRGPWMNWTRRGQDTMTSNVSRVYLPPFSPSYP